VKALHFIILSLFVLLTSACQQNPEESKVTGQIGYLERIALVPGSQAIIRLYDVSIADKKAELVAEQIILLKQQMPVNFELAFDADALNLNGIYSVRAVIQSKDGKLLWTTDTGYPIDTSQQEQDLGLLRLVKVKASQQSAQGNLLSLDYQCDQQLIKVTQLNSQLEVIVNKTPYLLNRIVAASGEKYQLVQPDLPEITFWRKSNEAVLTIDGEKASCQMIDTQASKNKVSNSNWLVTRINNLAVIENSKVSIHFSEQKIFGSAGCNQYTADYTTKGPEIELSTIAVTRKACFSAELAEQESRFLTLLGEISRFSVRDDGLILEDDTGHSLIAQ